MAGATAVVEVPQGSYADAKVFCKAARRERSTIRPSPSGLWAVARHWRSDEVIGVGCLWRPGRAPGKRLSGTYVLPEWRGQGISGRLVELRVEWARLAGVPYVDTRLYLHELVGPFAGWQVTRRWDTGILEARLDLA